MIFVRKVKTFLSLNNKTRLLFLEAFILLGWARILKILPFEKVAPSLGVYMEETSVQGSTVNREVLREISTAVHVMSRYTLWESQCMVKAVAAMKMLEKRKIESTLYLGIAKDETGKLIAHAWLRSGPYYLTGAEGMEKFTVVGQYAKYLKQTRKMNILGGLK